MSQSTLKLFLDMSQEVYEMHFYFDQVRFLLWYTAAASTLLLVLFIVKWICDTRRRKKNE